MSDPLLVPLSRLPGPCPLGSPVRLNDQPGMPCRLYVGFHDGLHWALVDGAVSGWGAAWLDLREPPVDADGYPLRVDGADVLFLMLRRYAGPYWGGPVETSDHVWLGRQDCGGWDSEDRLRLAGMVPNV